MPGSGYPVSFISTIPLMECAKKFFIKKFLISSLFLLLAFFNTSRVAYTPILLTSRFLPAIYVNDFLTRRNRGPFKNSYFFAPAKTNSMIKRLLLSAITILSILYSFGQETTSQILGLVSDGANPLAGATVTALHTPTGTKYTTTTRKDGRYNLDGLRVGGPYVLSVSYVGFTAEKQDGIFLTIGQDYAGDFKMTS